MTLRPVPRLITPPAQLPVSLALTKVQCRVIDNSEDALIVDMIEAAVSHLDGYTGILGRALEPQSWEVALDAFPACGIVLPLGPVASVTSITYRDALDAELTLNPAAYELVETSLEALVRPVGAWPAGSRVRVRWVAGTGCPAPIREAIRKLVAHAYDNRGVMSAEGAIAEMPLSVRDMIAPFRRIRL